MKLQSDDKKVAHAGLKRKCTWLQNC